MSEPPSSPRQKNSRAAWLLGALLVLLSTPGLLLVLYFLILNGWIIVGGGVAMLKDSLSSKPLRLESRVSVTAPDGRTRFIAEPDGSLRLEDVSRGGARILHRHRAAPQEYWRVEAQWLDNRRVLFSARYRYAALATGKSFLWDSKTGVVKSH